MNPYDFVLINWGTFPKRKEPLWHHRLTMVNNAQLYSGRIEVEIEAETPIFLPDTRANADDRLKSDPTKALPFMRRNDGDQVIYLLPGSSLKGVLRELVETLGNGCLTLFDGEYTYRHIRDWIEKNYEELVPREFNRCNKHTRLCIACRIFGMMGRGSRAEVFLGKVNISDAQSMHVVTHEPEYTLALMNPKPHHTAFYLDPAMEHIAGRKFYFHHEQPTFDSQYRFIGKNPQPINRRIHPLEEGTRFQFHVDFTNLEPDEFAALLLALRLEPTMRHKIGYGKPMGLGSVHFMPSKLILVDYARRYTVEGVLNGGSKSVREGRDLQTFIDAHIASYVPNFLIQGAMADLQRIWRWPPSADVRYEYPGQAWFTHHPTTRIAHTP
jgi:CRISPR/Cas system CSM-associated protein Csm3 (group 7 of RAMP superfamily)